MRLRIVLGLGLALAPAGAHAQTIWSRERTDGVIEFTNVPPAARTLKNGKVDLGGWKVLYRTGPGKAAAVRGVTDVVPARDTSPERFARFDQHIKEQEEDYGIPPALVRAVIKTESDFDPHVVSSAGAKGLMQLMPATARLMGVNDIFDVRQNIRGGSRYLQLMAQQFCRGEACSDDELTKVIAAYHAGPGAVIKYKGLPPYETTRQYVAAVKQRFLRYTADELAAEKRRAAQPTTTPPGRKLAER